MLGLGPFSLVATFLSSCEISNLYSIEVHYANWKLGVTLLSVLWHGVYDIYRSTLYAVVVRETTHDGHCQALTLLCFNLQACRGDRVRKGDRYTKTTCMKNNFASISQLNHCTWASYNSVDYMCNSPAELLL